MSDNVDHLTTFFEAVKTNNLNQVDELLQLNKVCVDAQNAKGKNDTALHVAAYNGYEKLAHLLVDEHKANVNVVNDYGLIPLQVAKDKYQAKICKFLIERNSDKSDYAKGILNSEDVDELFEAAENNNIKAVSELIENKGVDVDCVNKGSYHCTALHVAAKYGYEELARTLVDKYKANVNHMDDIGDRPIHVAAQNDHINIVKFLIEKQSMDADDVKDYLN